MKKEYIPTILIIVLLLGLLIYYYVFYNSREEDIDLKEVNVVPTLISDLKSDSVWCAPFQLIWNDLKNDLIKKDVVFINDENNQTVLDLNKETFTVNDISDNYYYKKHGVMTLNLKKEIEKGIQDKFREKSDILDQFDFSENSTNYLLYAMLYRKFEFTNPFDKLENDTFGIDSDSSNDLNNNVKVLYYNDYNNYAVKLETKDNDEVILVKGMNDRNNFQEIYNNMNTNNYSDFQNEDTISINNFDFKLKVNYQELENKEIKDSDFIISKTIQTINFTLDNIGGKVKSEAGMTMKNTAIMEGRYFNFTNNYVLFLKEKNRNIPYYAMKIDNIENFK